MSIMDERSAKALNHICDSALLAISCKGTDEYATAIRKYFDTFRNELIYYLCPDYDRIMRSSTVTPDYFDVANQIYMEIISDNDTVLGFVERFDPEKANNGFEGYFQSSIKREKNRFEKVYQNANARTGVTNVLTAREGATLRKIIKMCENFDIDSLSEERVKLICTTLNISEEKFRSLLYANRNAGAIHSDKGALDFALSDFVPDSNSSTVHKANLKPESFDVKDDSFEEFLYTLNDLYKKFPENVQAVYPTGFTGLFIQSKCEEVQERFKLSSKDTVVASYFDEMHLPDYRDFYADGRFICMVRLIFDISIDKRIVMLGKDIAAYLGISTGQYSKLMKKGENIIKGVE